MTSIGDKLRALRGTKDVKEMDRSEIVDALLAGIAVRAKCSGFSAWRVDEPHMVIVAGTLTYPIVVRLDA